jgi:hypothetical protein
MFRNMMLLTGVVMTFQVVFFFIGSSTLYNDLKLEHTTTNNNNSTLTTDPSSWSQDSTFSQESSLSTNSPESLLHPYTTTTLVFASNIGGLLVSAIVLTMLVPLKRDHTASANNDRDTLQWIHMIRCCSGCQQICYCLNTTLFLSVLLTTWVISLGAFLVLNVLHHVPTVDLFKINVLVAMSMVYAVSFLPIGILFCIAVCCTFKLLPRRTNNDNHTNTSNVNVNDNDSTMAKPLQVQQDKIVNYGTTYSPIDGPPATAITTPTAIVVIDNLHDEIIM